jgi:LacI family transcriptional regulator
MATIDDVAKQANVSKMTVSRALNNPQLLKEETRDRVLDVVKSLNYRPNMMAKGLVTKRSHTIAILIASISNPYHPRFVQGAEDACYENGYNVILCNANAKKKEHEYIDVLKDKMVDGIIFHHLNITMPEALELDQSGIKCVYIDNEKRLANATNMLIDQTPGAYMATDHLISLGHKRIGIIHGALAYEDHDEDQIYEHTFQFTIWNQRMEGYLSALADHDLRMDQKYMLRGDGGANKGIISGKIAVEKMVGGKAGRQAFLARADRPTAIYAQNDQMAIGAINGAMACGLRVPEDLSIIGHDGLDIGESLYPTLTTIEQPRYAIGYEAALTIIDMLEKRKEHHTINIKSKLVVRASTSKNIHI